MSFACEVIADSSGKWCGNGLVFSSETEAQEYLRDLRRRWMAVRDVRVVASDKPATHTYVNHELEAR